MRCHLLRLWYTKPDDAIVIDLILLNTALRVLNGNLNPFVSSFYIKHASDFVAGHVTNYYPRNV
jgi:hypothetical protein